MPRVVAIRAWYSGGRTFASAGSDLAPREATPTWLRRPPFARRSGLREGGRLRRRQEASLSRFWRGLPGTGVLAVMLYEETRTPEGTRTRRLLSGRDHYYRAGPVFAHTDASADEIRKLAPFAEIKRGELVADGEYETVIAEAMAAKEP